MEGASASYRNSYIGASAPADNRRASTAYEGSANGSMGPPASVSRAPGYSSMSGGAYSMHSSEHHPPGKAATGGQSHGHRPVSAMPTPINRAPVASPRQMEHNTSVMNAINKTAFADRRASAHPTMTSSATYQGSLAPSMPMSPGMDAAMAGAISNGIPATSPAALQYFAAHPRRQQVHFGNYLLLQTLGEGEFGKVKLGVHKEWGEEVAVKLIKRDKVGTPDGHLQITGPSKDPSKMSKVEKEIRVLKDVRHPNIVRLYEVIESDRYIGIVLEYASGGELFDHILAHKYLKERDACRLFAQLISGVSYLHNKKIVHRDLKLENLLLDRNRNVIITDFGFANNFENKKDDLMATSCGSPCYAAPELVVQDGLYAGSAVDVWSCGVILYAMLAGYLPYDDDPKNPEGDNINLLYKYIMATPLSFPDYITAEPRDLLCKMLVPDPLKRATLETVMAHPWLSPYRDLFQFSVEDLEKAAMEQQNKKRMVYRQQMLMQQQLAEQQQAAAKSGRPEPSAADARASRRQSAMPTSSTMSDRMYDSTPAFSPPAANTRSRPVTGLPSLITTVPEGAVVPTIAASPVSPGTVTSVPVAANKKAPAPKSHRHTVQLEYTGAGVDRRASSATPSTISEEVPPVPKLAKQEEVDEEEALEDATASKSTTPAAPSVIPAVPTVVPATERKTSATAKAAEGSSNGAKDDKDNSMTTRTTSNPLPSSMTSPSIAAPVNRAVSGEAAPRPETRRSSSARKSDASAMAMSRSDQGTNATSAQDEERRANRQRKGLSTDKLFFNKLKSSTDGTDLPPSPGAQEEQPELGRKNSNRRKAMSLVVGKYMEQPASTKDKASVSTPTSKTAKEERRLTGRMRKDTLTSQPGSTLATPAKNGVPEQRNRSPSSASILNSSMSSRLTGKSNGPPPFDQRNNESNSTVGASTGAAKKVMDWFRKKSVSKGAYDERPPMSPTDFGAVSPTSEVAPRVVVTKETEQEEAEEGEKAERLASGAGLESVPSSRSTSGTHSQASQATEYTAQTTPTEASVSDSVAGGKSSSSASTVQPHPQQKEATPTPPAFAAAAMPSPALAAPKAPAPASVAPRVTRSSRAKVDDSNLRVHQGAVDQSALTSKSPQEVLLQVQRALYEMGIETTKEREEEYKFECVRRKRAKTLIGATQGIGASIRTSVFPPTQADLEKSTSSRQPPSPGATSPLTSSQSSAGGLRTLLGRRASVVPQPAANLQLGDMPAPMYGEASVDGGQEIRFSVEITKIKNLPGLYSLDIRRMKGNIWSFKHVYYALLQRCELNSSDI